MELFHRCLLLCFMILGEVAGHETIFQKRPQGLHSEYCPPPSFGISYMPRTLLNTFADFDINNKAESMTPIPILPYKSCSVNPFQDNEKMHKFRVAVFKSVLHAMAKKQSTPNSPRKSQLVRSHRIVSRGMRFKLIMFCVAMSFAILNSFGLLGRHSCKLPGCPFNNPVTLHRL